MAEKKLVARYQPGDRVRISKDVQTMPALPHHIGIVKEVVPSYADKSVGYNLRLEEDPRPTRTWFFLQHQLTAAGAADSEEEGE